MQRYWFIDAHSLQFQDTLLEFQENHWCVLKTRQYFQSANSQEWTQSFYDTWPRVQKEYADVEKIFLLPDAWVGNLSITVPEDPRFSLKQKIIRALQKNFRFRFHQFEYRFTPQGEQTYHLQYIAKKQLSFLRSLVGPSVHLFSSTTGCWAYFQQMILDQWPHIAIFIEPPLRRILAYTHQTTQAVDFYSRSPTTLLETTNMATKSLHLNLEGKRVTLLGTFDSEFVAINEKEFSYQMIQDIPSLTGEKSSLSILSQTAYLGILSLLQKPTNPLCTLDFFKAKASRCSTLLFVVQRILDRSLLKCLLVLWPVLCFLVFQTYHSVQQQEQQYQQLCHTQKRFQSLQKSCKTIRQENAARTFLPQKILTILHALQEIEEHFCVDQLSFETSKKPTLLLLKGRFQGNSDLFRVAIQQAFPKECTHKSFSLQLQFLQTSSYQFTLQLPITLPPGFKFYEKQ